MEKVKEEGIENWSEHVEDLVDSGDVETAITFLESVIETLNPSSSSDSVSQLQLFSALSDLANIYSSNGFSVKAHDLQSRASLIKQRLPNNSTSSGARVLKESNEDGVGTSSPNNVTASSSSKDSAHASTVNASDDDDWEAVADREADELLSTVANLKLENTKSQTPKRRGRGTFSYEKNKLYSDQVLDSSTVDAEDDETPCSSEEKRDTPNLKYGTSHVLVLADFSPSTRTTDLEKLFEGFKDRGFVIRWVNDTVALAVFQTPSVALEAQNSVRCSFNVRILDEDDILLSSIKARDLEPPRQRPKTSAHAAQRLIAHGMGLKLSSLSGGSREHKKQENARRERIVNRQKLRDEAWGDD